MSIRYVNKYASSTATDAPANRSKAAGIGYDVALAKIVYNDGGTLRELMNRSNPIVSATAGTLAVTAAAHDGRTVVLNLAGGITVTLPAATGSGARYKFVVGTALSAASHVIQVANATDFFRGNLLEGADDSSGAAKAWSTANTGTVATESDTLTLDGSTKSGFVGTVVEIEDVASAVFTIQVRGSATGTEVSPFSVAV